MNDLEIARLYKMKPILEIGRKIGLSENELFCYGSSYAKVDVEKIIPNKKAGKLILVTAMSPTPFGEGKTTVSIGLGDAFGILDSKALIVLREPSLGPVFGMKGGATGGGYSQMVPMEDINLHFTGDFHAITSANNLICAAIDNHLYFGNELNIDPTTISFNRCLDINDRSLREVEVGLSSSRETNRLENFQITAASEIMTILCLANDFEDLRLKLENIMIGYNYNKEPIFVRDLSITGSLLVLLKDAIKPNLVQTLEGNPVIVHGGPFANIAHGCNSIIATKLGLAISDYVVTESGFGADLGAEKFFDIKCRLGELSPRVVVLVATIKALKYHGGVLKEKILENNPEAIKNGLSNLEAHINNLKKFGVEVIVALNKYSIDSDEEINIVRNFCELQNTSFEITTSYIDGGRGAVNLAKKVINLAKLESNFKCLYDLNLTLKEKIECLATEIYHANNIVYSELALAKIKEIEHLTRKNVPICVAKTQYSLSDDPKLLGNPQNHTLHVTDIRYYYGAGFITVILGDIMTMPGLPKRANYEKIDVIDQDIIGLS